MLKMGWIISPYTVKQAAFDLQQKETGSKTVAIATSKYLSCGAYLSVQRASQIPVVLHHYLQRYSLFCVLTSILSHLMTSSVHNLHNTKILNISETRWDMTKRKTPFFFTFKGLSNLPINTSIFHFIGTLSMLMKCHEQQNLCNIVHLNMWYCSQMKLDVVQPRVVYCNVCKAVDEIHFVRNLIRGLVYQG